MDNEDYSALNAALLGRPVRRNYRAPPVENVPNERVTGDALRHANAWMGAADRWALNIPSTVAGLILPGNSLHRARQASEAAQDDFRTLYHRDLLAMGPRRLKEIKGVNDFAHGFAGKFNLD